MPLPDFPKKVEPAPQKVLQVPQFGLKANPFEISEEEVVNAAKVFFFLIIC